MVPAAQGGDSKTVDQKVLEVVRAAEQLVTSSSSNGPTAAATNKEDTGDHRKTTTIIMTKHTVQPSTTTDCDGPEPERLTFSEKKRHFEHKIEEQLATSPAESHKHYGEITLYHPWTTVNNHRVGVQRGGGMPVVPALLPPRVRRRNLPGEPQDLLSGRKVNFSTQRLFSVLQDVRRKDVIPPQVPR
ncbi:let-413 [Cordylochernes scorpioides]|uniref:Let-413 n=1 Tax=Cordylochernes scorpioides TaxID=51811 RepID=A0ABY6JZG4_9ARAC|nr:let-413 [Cordylochernes scorpioides]